MSVGRPSLSPDAGLSIFPNFQENQHCIHVSSRCLHIAMLFLEMLTTLRWSLHANAVCCCRRCRRLTWMESWLSFQTFVFVVIPMKEIFENIFSWGRKAYPGMHIKQSTCVPWGGLGVALCIPSVSTVYKARVLL